MGCEHPGHTHGPSPRVIQHRLVDPAWLKALYPTQKTTVRSERSDSPFTHAWAPREYSRRLVTRKPTFESAQSPVAPRLEHFEERQNERPRAPRRAHDRRRLSPCCTATPPGSGMASRRIATGRRPLIGGIDSRTPSSDSFNSYRDDAAR